MPLFSLKMCFSTRVNYKEECMLDAEDSNKTMENYSSYEWLIESPDSQSSKTLPFSLLLGVHV